MEDRQQQLELMQTEFDHLLQIIDHNSSQLEGNIITISYCRGNSRIITISYYRAHYYNIIIL